MGKSMGIAVGVLALGVVLAGCAPRYVLRAEPEPVRTVVVVPARPHRTVMVAPSEVVVVKTKVKKKHARGRGHGRD